MTFLFLFSPVLFLPFLFFSFLAATNSLHFGFFLPSFSRFCFSLFPYTFLLLFLSCSNELTIFFFPFSFFLSFSFVLHTEAPAHFQLLRSAAEQYSEDQMCIYRNTRIRKLYPPCN